MILPTLKKPLALGYLLRAFGTLCMIGIVGAIVVLLPGTAHAQAEKVTLNARLDQIETDRLAFQKDLAQREEACLKRFFSGSCMDKIRTEHLTQMRAFDLQREETLQKIRDLDAEIRSRSREQRIEERDAKQKQGAAK